MSDTNFINLRSASINRAALENLATIDESRVIIVEILNAVL
jgi:hypothetical protein